MLLPQQYPMMNLFPSQVLPEGVHLGRWPLRARMDMYGLNPPGYVGVLNNLFLSS